MKAARRRVDGVFLLDKPLGLSSNSALQRVKKLYNAEKAGHTGTLDPLATGLLPILLGEATKFGSALLDSDKGYLADLMLGIRTTTGDAEGEVVAQRPVALARADFDIALAAFRGAIKQIPPMYSALKRDGKALYQYARAGETVEREARPVSIHELEVEFFEPPRATLRVRCSKGTYIRSLAEDLGEALGCGAHLSALRRTAVGPFDLSTTVDLDRLERAELGERDRMLLPTARLLADLPQLALDAEQKKRFCQGQSLVGEWNIVGRTQVLGDGTILLGIGVIGEDGILRP
ncbi:MAG TPA: tRNA pseudouridine(55) synthase TruB, partial [Burkholderiales bacterium]|nr:tRNA pseudouridine(55) synthase TruB [Burkholderiales bacterium]